MSPCWEVITCQIFEGLSPLPQDSRTELCADQQSGCVADQHNIQLYYSEGGCLGPQKFDVITSQLATTTTVYLR